MKLMPSSKARFTQATARSRSTPTPYVSHDPRDISETFKSLAPSFQYFTESPSGQMDESSSADFSTNTKITAVPYQNLIRADSSVVPIAWG
jgi:hypothetical protein